MTTSNPASALRRMAAPLKLIAAGLLFLAGTAGLRAVDVDDCTEEAFRSAIETAFFGETVTFTEDCEIVLNDSPVDIFQDVIIDAQGFNVTISSGTSNALFNVIEGSAIQFTLIGVTLTEGHNTNGGAMYIPSDAFVVVSNCTFLENTAIGTNGAAGVNGGNGGTIGHEGARGTPGQSALGGAIFNLGELAIFESRFFTNSATGGDGGNGGNGGNGSLEGGDGGNGGTGGLAFGGAIYTEGSLVLSNCTFAGNLATGGNGGAGGTNGTGPTAGRFGTGGEGGTGTGAGVSTAFSEFLTFDPTIINCTFMSNVVHGGTAGAGTGKLGGSARRGATAMGGGVANASILNVINSTFFANDAIGGNGADGGVGGSGGNGFGGGLYNTGTVTVVNCTFSHGSALGGTNGAGNGSTFTAGQMGRGFGGNLANVAAKKSDNHLFLQNSIIATNFGGGGGYGVIIDLGDNISADKKTKLNKKISLTKTDPKLGPLADNGGPTLTMAIGTNSPALDAAEFDAPDFDQRGRARPVGDASDIGAYEFESSAPIILTLSSQPVFQDAINRIVVQTNGGNVVLTVSVFGDMPMSYRWFHITNSGSTNRVATSLNSFSTVNSLTLTNLTTNNVGRYFVTVSNLLGVATSPLITVTNANQPVITSQPTNQVVTNGATVAFSVTATGDPPLAYQWRINGTNVVNATNTTLTITGVTVTNLGTYTVFITNKVGSVISSGATLSMLPFISSQPADQTVAEGGTATFSVSGGGSPPFSFAWFHNGTQISGQTNFTYSKGGISTNDAGTYQVVVSNPFGSIDSRLATLTVTPAPPSPSMARVAQTLVAPPAAEPLLSAVSLHDGTFSFAFPGETGVTYEVEYKDSLMDPDWTPLLTNFGTGEWVTNEFPASNATRFFRIRVR